MQSSNEPQSQGVTGLDQLTPDITVIHFESMAYMIWMKQTGQAGVNSTIILSQKSDLDVWLDTQGCICTLPWKVKRVKETRRRVDLN